MKQIDIKDIVIKAKEILLIKGKHIPQFIGYSSKGLIIATLIINSNDEKEIAIEFIRRIVKENDIKKYWIIMEAWKTEMKEGEKLFRRAGRDINRVECLVISEFNSDMKCINVCVPFKRVNDKIVFEKEQTTKESSSIWNIYLEKEGIKERMDKEIDKINDKFFKKIYKDLSKKYKDEFFRTNDTNERKKILLKLILEGRTIIKEQNKTILEDTEDEIEKEN